MTQLPLTPERVLEAIDRAMYRAFDVTTNCNYNMNKRFEWDEAKRQINIRKHGFDFVGIQAVFEGTTLTIEDDRFDYGETRYITFGFWNARIVYLVHTETEKVIRIISVPKATKYEEKEFLRQIGYGLEEN